MVTGIYGFLFSERPQKESVHFSGHPLYFYGHSKTKQCSPIDIQKFSLFLEPFAKSHCHPTVRIDNAEQDKLKQGDQGFHLRATLRHTDHLVGHGRDNCPILQGQCCSPAYQSPVILYLASPPPSSFCLGPPLSSYHSIVLLVLLFPCFMSPFSTIPTLSSLHSYSSYCSLCDLHLGPLMFVLFCLLFQSGEVG